MWRTRNTGLARIVKVDARAAEALAGVVRVFTGRDLPLGKQDPLVGMAVDSTGKVIGQRIEWVPGGLPGFTQTYFEIGHLPATPSYRVTVWDYTFIESRRAEAP